MIICSIENTDQYLEAIDSKFKFNGNAGVIRFKGSIVGFYNIKYEDSSEICLDDLEIVGENKGKGFGRQFIEYLFKNYPEANLIYGRATHGSVGFYDKIGGVYVEAESNAYVLQLSEKALKNPLEDEELDDVMLRDFIIYRENFFAVKNMD